MVLQLFGATGKAVTLGPANWFRLRGRELFGPNNKLLLRYAEGFWKDHEQQFSSIICQGPVTCHFEQGAARRDDVEGPFKTLTLASGVLWGDELSLARYDIESKRWRLLHTDNSFAAVVWLPAHQGPRPPQR